MSASRTYTADFRDHFARAEQRLLRRRFMWFSGVLGGIGVATFLLIMLSFVLRLMEDGDISTARLASDGADGARGILSAVVTMGISSIAYCGSFLYAWLGAPSDRNMIRVSLGLVIVDGVLNIAIRALDLLEMPGVPVGGISYFMITHLIACAVLPWTLGQATLAAGMVLIVNAVSLQFEANSPGVAPLIQAVASCSVAVPGTLIAWARRTQRMKGHQLRFVQAKYGEVRRELTDARRIHEAMFPVPKTTGDVRFTYRYQPMRQIGGDFLHVASPEGPGDPLSVVLLDVTGHGIPAALTVNRLFGELDRVFAEDPSIQPSDVLGKLNRYVHLTMSDHSVFVTGLAVRVDVKHGVLEYANAGHPPAFLMSVDGRIDQLDSTGMMLGATSDGASDPRTLRFGEGDRLIAYTDGATEARNGEGDMLRISGLQRVLASTGAVAEGSWPLRILDAVDGHRSGPPDDDTLVVEIYRPVTP